MKRKVPSTVGDGAFVSVGTREEARWTSYFKRGREHEGLTETCSFAQEVSTRPINLVSIS